MIICAENPFVYKNHDIKYLDGYICHATKVLTTKNMLLKIDNNSDAIVEDNTMQAVELMESYEINSFQINAEISDKKISIKLCSYDRRTKAVTLLSLPFIKDKNEALIYYTEKSVNKIFASIRTCLERRKSKYLKNNWENIVNRIIVFAEDKDSLKLNVFYFSKIKIKDINKIKKQTNDLVYNKLKDYLTND